MMDYSAVIVAAGSGERMHLGYNKAYYRLDEKTVLEHSMSIFLEDTDCRQVIVVTNQEDYRKNIFLQDERITIASGGSSRQESVSNGLKLVKEAVVLIHDGARPYLSRDCLSRIKLAMQSERAACLMVPVKDTVKEVSDGYVQKTLPRNKLMNAQTPQAFETELLRTCMEKAEHEQFQGTDDCSLVERYSGVRIKVVEGDYANLKITTQDDIKNF